MRLACRRPLIVVVRLLAVLPIVPMRLSLVNWLQALIPIPKLAWLGILQMTTGPLVDLLMVPQRLMTLLREGWEQQGTMMSIVLVFVLRARLITCMARVALPELVLETIGMLMILPMVSISLIPLLTRAMGDLLAALPIIRLLVLLVMRHPVSPRVVVKLMSLLDPTGAITVGRTWLKGVGLRRRTLRLSTAPIASFTADLHTMHSDRRRTCGTTIGIGGNVATCALVCPFVRNVGVIIG